MGRKGHEEGLKGHGIKGGGEMRERATERGKAGGKWHGRREKTRRRGDGRSNTKKEERREVI